MSKDGTMTILFYGIGGQGVLSAAEICARAAIEDGYHVKKSEIKGMAQRGGSVEAYVRLGTKVHSPLPERGRVDLLACLYESEYERLRSELKKGGYDLFPYLKKARAAVGDKKIFLNTYILGIVSSLLPVRESSWITAMERTFKRNFEQNRQYFLQGREAGARNDL